MLIKLGSAVAGTVALLAMFYPVVHPPAFSGWKQVVVTPGQTEWEICHQYCPNADTRDVVQALIGYNHVGDKVQPGDMLWVPTKATPARLDFFMSKNQ